MSYLTLDLEADADSMPDLSAPELWQQAEAEEAPALARAAAALGALDAAVEDAPWLLPRLALLEAEAMLWAQGIILRSEDIGRDLLAARSGADAEGLMQARWCIRRLVPAHTAGEVALRRPELRDLRSFLALHRVEVAGFHDDAPARLCGADFDAASQDFLTALDQLADRHPLTRAAAAQYLWRQNGLSAVEDVIEAASYSAILASTDLQYLRFAPLGQYGQTAWRSGGSAAMRLAQWLEAVRAGAHEARQHMRRLRAWRDDALGMAAKMKGDTPGRLIEAALQRPLIGTEDAERALGISRDSAERGLARLQSMGILREVTGRGRFRLWTVGR
ncbi:helix-turn-helix domain-containing protein [Paracoccus sp. (in: a-proteobacteria)]|uniref:helix-turn-helix domain-containing protein n=1 Tax=Paracoccus sp. TaxID=267 RepID=UPI002898F0C0|nr:helix-turn-helix domain-containing protein [Paracoccus sp. (in: a-proteobacteria)]